MIYKGSQKEGKVYIGGTKIGKIYKGGTLVYQSQKQLRLYGYKRSNYEAMPCGMIGGFTTSFPYYQSSSNGKYYAPIDSISGTIGQANSVVYYTSNNQLNATYRSSHWINGILLHFYLGGSGTWRGVWVMDGSTVGSTLVFCHYNNTDYTLGFPTSANTSSIQFPIYNAIETAYRDSSLDKTWTINGVY